MAGLEDVAAEELALAGFRSPPRDLGVTPVVLGSANDLDGVGVLPETFRLARALGALKARLFALEDVANGATDAEANTGVPPFCPHDAERGRAGAEDTVSIL